MSTSVLNILAPFPSSGNRSIWDEEVDLPTADLPTAALANDVEYIPTVDFTVYCAGCRYWSEDNGGGWSSDGCKV